MKRWFHAGSSHSQTPQGPNKGLQDKLLKAAEKGATAEVKKVSYIIYILDILQIKILIIGYLDAFSNKNGQKVCSKTAACPRFSPNIFFIYIVCCY